MKKLILLTACLAVLLFPLQAQFLIWDTTKVYHYDYLMKYEGGDTISFGKIEISPTSKPNWNPGQISAFYKYTYSYVDSNFLASDIYCSQFDLLPTNEEGYIQTDKRFWTHPFRYNSLFCYTEVAPYPSIHLSPTKIKGKLMIGEGWGKFSNMNVKSKTEKGPNRSFMFKHGDITAESYHSTSKCKLGKAKLDLYYDNEIGILLYDYSFINGETLEVKLNKITSHGKIIFE